MVASKCYDTISESVREVDRLSGPGGVKVGVVCEKLYHGSSKTR